MSIIKYKRIFSTLATSTGGGGGGSTITVATNYSSLPAAVSVPGQFYWCSNNDGIHLTGIYYSNGTSWEYNPADDITVVSNYSSLPAPNTVPAQFYWCSNSQGTRWLPGSLGGTYYSAGLYFSNGTTWEFLNVAYQATQAEVDAGTNTDKFVTPSTFANASKWGNYVPYTGATGDVDLGAHIMNAQSFHAKGTAGNGHLGLKHQSADSTASASESVLFADVNGDPKWKIDGNYYSTLKYSGNTADRTYTFQNASGTLAFISDIPAPASTTLTGDVTGTGTGTVSTTIASNSVTNSKMATMAAYTIKANNTASSAAPQDIAISDLILMLRDPSRDFIYQSKYQNVLNFY